MWDVVVATLRDEFSLGEVHDVVRVLSRLLLAVVLAAVVGYERERQGSTAGLRTHMLVALGVALALLTADLSGFDVDSQSRVMQGLFAGIGFLGAGAIIKQGEREQVKGLTTAASIWATAGIAAAAGMGRGGIAVVATVLALVILSVLLQLERRYGLHPQDRPPGNGTGNGNGSS